MVNITYKPLSALTPIELKYEYYKDEKVQTSLVTYNNGASLYNTGGLNNFKDLTINRDTCLVLTPAIELSSIFTKTNNIFLGQLPGSFQLQPRDTLIYFAKYRPFSNSFFLELNDGSTFYIQPLKNSNEVEIFVDNRYLQVDASYPYVVRTGDKTLDPESIHRQRFEVVYQNKLITFKTKTDSGYRYLAFNEDNILRATGLIMNDSVINDYVFKCIDITSPELTQGFTPTNNWITYFYDIEEVTNNRNVVVNKNFASVKTNFLVDFPTERAADTGKININIANLKTGVTPSGGPAPVNNAYTKNPITSN